MRKPLKVELDPKSSMSCWMSILLGHVRDLGPREEILRDLLRAYLEVRFPSSSILVREHSRGRSGSERQWSLQVGPTVYYIVSAASKSLLENCRSDKERGLCPVVLVPQDQLRRATRVASSMGMRRGVSIWAQEDYFAMGLVGIQGTQKTESLDTLREVLTRYNDRIIAAESDQALRIDLT